MANGIRAAATSTRANIWLNTENVMVNYVFRFNLENAQSRPANENAGFAGGRRRKPR